MDIMMRTHRSTFPAALLGVFVLVWIALAIAPWYRADWLLENILVFVAVPGLVLAHRRLPFSNWAYGQWRWWLPWFFVVSHATLFEIVEPAAAVVFGGDLGEACLGTQCDGWDSQKDSALAALGAAVTVIVLRASRRARQVHAHAAGGPNVPRQHG